MPSAKPESHFSVVLVAYNSADVIGAAIKSIPAGHQVIVADNGSTDDSVAIAERLGADILKLGRNFGFGTACNRGAEMARHDKVLFLNPDATVEKDTLDKLSQALDDFPEAGIAAPRILNSKGEVFFRKRSKLYTTWPWQRKPVPEESTFINNPSGAALALRKADFDRIGGFDEKIFLYFEDDDLCFRIRTDGKKIRYVYDAIVHHAVGKSTPVTPALVEFKEYHFNKAARYVCIKHGRFFPRWYKVADTLFKMAIAKVRHQDMRMFALRGKLKALLE